MVWLIFEYEDTAHVHDMSRAGTLHSAWDGSTKAYQQVGRLRHAHPDRVFIVNKTYVN